MVTDEAQALSTVIAHLQDQFPRVPAQTIADEARSVFREYDRASVRTFLPILVERQAGERLRGFTVA